MERSAACTAQPVPGVDIKCVFVKYPYARQSEMGNMRLKNDAHTNYVRFSIYLFYR